MTALQQQMMKQQQEFNQWQHEQEVWKIELQQDMKKCRPLQNHRNHPPN